MTKRTFVDKNGNSWEWEETPEVIKAIDRFKAIEKMNSTTVLQPPPRKPSA
jgi:hypothetical protein